MRFFVFQEKGFGGIGKFGILLFARTSSRSFAQDLESRQFSSSRLFAGHRHAWNAHTPARTLY